MNSRLATLLLALLFAGVQAQLWLGRGNVASVADMQRKLDDQRARNALARETNARLAAEVRDLQEGLEMVEEKARMELGMVKPNEILVQYAK